MQVDTENLQKKEIEENKETIENEKIENNQSEIQQSIERFTSFLKVFEEIYVDFFESNKKKNATAFKF